MPSPEQDEYARVLLERATSDLQACQVLVDLAAIGDDVVGFHAQQAVEKALKAVLVGEGVDFPRTHNLRYLATLVTDQSIDLPSDLNNPSWLTPWGAQMRYDEPTSSLDRVAAVQAARVAVSWAHSLLVG